MLARAHLADLTYVAKGSTLDGTAPAGFRHQHHETVLGRGKDIFDSAKQGLRSWKAHEIVGLHVWPGSVPLEKGRVVVVTWGTPFAALAAPCRIVAVVDDADQFGFAYGTLPGHPESGEELFLVTMTDNIVKFQITSISKPAGTLARLAGPLGRSAQRIATLGYLRALREFVHQTPSA